MAKTYKLLIFLMMIASSAMFAQNYNVSGQVTEEASGDPLIGANVYLENTSIGAATDENGRYDITVPKGEYTLMVSYIGYNTINEEINVNQNMQLDYQMEEYEFSLSLTVLADRAKERETPVAFTNVDKKEMEYRLGSRDIPLVLNTTPSVYATENGGGAGDARINVRGFNQRNVAIMINGVPINDMENGWVYWSNWDGIGDATSSIQLQRGLSAINLATPSVGGTMNVITDPAGQTAGVQYKQEIGSDGFFKSTLEGNTGLINDKYAFSASVVRKTGDGVIEKTWTDAWAYYFGASFNINSRNRLEAYFMGAPQRHGQNLYRQNIGVYSADYAKDLDGYDPAALDQFTEVGRLYNQTWNSVDPSYEGKQSWNGNESERYDPAFINERENFYHKPLANLNYYSQLSDNLSWYTTLYYSGGTGGGSGTLGSLVWDYTGPSRRADWNATIERNRNAENGSTGILRNSNNNQWTIGAISKAYYKFSKAFRTSFGVDWRTAEIEHFRDVRDLLGGEYFFFDGNEFDSESNYRKGLGDKIDYFFTNTVDWLGFYGEGEYTAEKVTVYGMGGFSNIKYTYTNHFLKDNAGNELYAESDNISGYQIKGGANYRLNKDFSVFANIGYVSKVPIFDQVISDRDGTKVEDPKNEIFNSYEAGVNYLMLEGRLNLKLNYYYTTWKDRTTTRTIINQDGTDALVVITGMDALHSGFEFEGIYQPARLVRFDASASIGNWKYLNDVSGIYKDYSTSAEEDVPYNFYVDGLKVGDAPQTQLALGLSLFPIDGFRANAILKYNTSFYADWDPFDRTDETDRTQSWEVPSYTLIDLHFAYDIPFNLQGVNFQLFAHVFNLLDTEYISDATDNSAFNAYGDNGKTHSADDAEVYFGLPRTFNVGVSVRL